MIVVGFEGIDISDFLNNNLRFRIGSGLGSAFGISAVATCSGNVCYAVVVANLELETVNRFFLGV